MNFPLKFPLNRSILQALLCSRKSRRSHLETITNYHREAFKPFLDHSLKSAASNAKLEFRQWPKHVLSTTMFKQ